MRNKVEHQWSVICEKSFIDVESNNLSLINTLERIQLVMDPLKGVSIEGGQDAAASVVPINYELVTLWHRTTKSGDIKIPVKVDIIDPNGNIITSIDYQIEILKGQMNYRFRTRFLGMKITVPGIYRYVSRIRQDKVFREAGSVSVEVLMSVNNSPSKAS